MDDRQFDELSKHLSTGLSRKGILRLLGGVGAAGISAASVLLPAEAKKIVDKGFASGALGTGPEAERHKRLRDLVNKTEAETAATLDQNVTEAMAMKDGNELVKLGNTYVSMGQVDKGIELIEKGIAKGGLKRPDDAKLRLGLAQLQSPKQKAKALQTLRSVGGNDGTSDIARMWALVGQQT